MINYPKKTFKIKKCWKFFFHFKLFVFQLQRAPFSPLKKPPPQLKDETFEMENNNPVHHFSITRIKFLH